mmetsp:Transcript_57951/g.86088  ORF Transcript_57951/g.86088 Transcript_57951/m.86088 type:complete len:103 (+) Transcript_57951:1075-1383(+)
MIHFKLRKHASSFRNGSVEEINFHQLGLGGIEILCLKKCFDFFLKKANTHTHSWNKVGEPLFFSIGRMQSSKKQQKILWGFEGERIDNFFTKKIPTSHICVG